MQEKKPNPKLCSDVTPVMLSNQKQMHALCSIFSSLSHLSLTSSQNFPPDLESIWEWHGVLQREGSSSGCWGCPSPGQDQKGISSGHPFPTPVPRATSQSPAHPLNHFSDGTVLEKDRPRSRWLCQTLHTRSLHNHPTLLKQLSKGQERFCTSSGACVKERLWWGVWSETG